MPRPVKLKELVSRLCGPGSDYRAAKRMTSEKFLGVPVRGRYIKLTKQPLELIANLVGIGVAEKRTNRKSVGLPAITFYVKEKLPKSRLTRRLLLPKTIAGLTCDVVACGAVKPAQGGSPSDPLDPVTPGAQIQVEGAEPGTLGGFVTDADGEECLISNCHVLSADLATGEGASVFQPAFGFPGSRRIATVKTVVSISANGRNRVDVALARMDSGIRTDHPIPGIGAITGTGRPSPGRSVAKYGQTTENTDGQFDSMDTDVVVSFGFSSALFARVYVFRPGSFAGAGDSGSLVVEPGSGTVVGIIFATSALLNFAIPAEAVEDEVGPLTWL